MSSLVYVQFVNSGEQEKRENLLLCGLMNSHGILKRHLNHFRECDGSYAFHNTQHDIQKI